MSVHTQGRWDCRTGAFSNEPLRSIRPFLECSRLVVDVETSPGAWVRRQRVATRRSLRSDKSLLN